MAGVDPNPFTLRELSMMATGRMKAEWCQTSQVLWILYSVNRDPKKSKKLSPSDFDPFGSKARRERNRPDVVLSVREAKAAFVERSAETQIVDAKTVMVVTADEQRKRRGS